MSNLRLIATSLNEHVEALITAIGVVTTLHLASAGIAVAWFVISPAPLSHWIVAGGVYVFGLALCTRAKWPPLTPGWLRSQRLSVLVERQLTSPIAPVTSLTALHERALSLFVAGSMRATALLDRLSAARCVAVVGVDPYSADLAARLKTGGRRRFDLVGIYQQTRISGPSAPIHQGGLLELAEYSRSRRLDAVVIALEAVDVDCIESVLHELRNVATDIYLATGLLEMTCQTATIDRLASVAMLKLRSPPLSKPQIQQKRLLDVAIALVLLFALLPLLITIATFIRLDSRGPVLFRQPRRGYNNGSFQILKFRTMYHDQADLHAEHQTTRGDPRVTRLGKLLRRTSLDELPQLLNVLRGEMSLVGPRPHAFNTKAGSQLFQDVVNDYGLRYRVRPGITGWAQVNGWRGQTSTREQIERRVACDLFYIEHWSIMFDLRIILLTAYRMFDTRLVY